MESELYRLLVHFGAGFVITYLLMMGVYLYMEWFGD